MQVYELLMAYIQIYVTLFRVNRSPHQKTSNCAKIQILQTHTVKSSTLAHFSILHLNLILPDLFFKCFPVCIPRKFPMELQIPPQLFSSQASGLSFFKRLSMTAQEQSQMNKMLTNCRLTVAVCIYGYSVVIFSPVCLSGS